MDILRAILQAIILSKKTLLTIYTQQKQGCTTYITILYIYTYMYIVWYSRHTHPQFMTGMGLWMSNGLTHLATIPRVMDLLKSSTLPSINMIPKRSDDWDEWLPFLLFAYRTSVHESTKQTLFYLMFGRDPRLPTQRALTPPKFTLFGGPWRLLDCSCLKFEPCLAECHSQYWTCTTSTEDSVWP